MDHFIESGGAVSPPSTPGAASVKYATKGNALTATPASKPGEYWYHMITESLRQVIVAAGLTPLYSNLSLLKDSIVALINTAVRGNSLGVLTLSGASQEWTSIPAGVARVEIYGRGVSLDGTDEFALQLGTSSYIVTGYNGQLRQDSLGSSTWSTQAIMSRGSAAAGTTAFRAVLELEPGTNIWHIYSVSNRDDNNSNAVSVAIGSVNLSAALQKIKIKSVVSANFDAGTAFARYW